MNDNEDTLLASADTPPKDDGSECSKKQGSCDDVNQKHCSSGFKPGLCPGASNIQCCTGSVTNTNPNDAKTNCYNQCDASVETCIEGKCKPKPHDEQKPSGDCTTSGDMSCPHGTDSMNCCLADPDPLKRKDKKEDTTPKDDKANGCKAPQVYTGDDRYPCALPETAEKVQSCKHPKVYHHDYYPRFRCQTQATLNKVIDCEKNRLGTWSGGKCNNAKLSSPADEIDCTQYEGAPNQMSYQPGARVKLGDAQGDFALALKHKCETKKKKVHEETTGRCEKLDKIYVDKYYDCQSRESAKNIMTCKSHKDGPKIYMGKDHGCQSQESAKKIKDCTNKFGKLLEDGRCSTDVKKEQAFKDSIKPVTEAERTQHNIDTCKHNFCTWNAGGKKCECKGNPLPTDHGLGQLGAQSLDALDPQITQTRLPAIRQALSNVKNSFAMSKGRAPSLAVLQGSAVMGNAIANPGSVDPRLRQMDQNDPNVKAAAFLIAAAQNADDLFVGSAASATCGPLGPICGFAAGSVHGQTTGPMYDRWVADQVIDNMMYPGRFPGWATKRDALLKQEDSFFVRENAPIPMPGTPLLPDTNIPGDPGHQGGRGYV
jgi:hypothetical protein